MGWSKFPSNGLHPKLWILVSIFLPTSKTLKYKKCKRMQENIRRCVTCGVTGFFVGRYFHEVALLTLEWTIRKRVKKLIAVIYINSLCAFTINRFNFRVSNASTGKYSRRNVQADATMLGIQTGKPAKFRTNLHSGRNSLQCLQGHVLLMF